MHVTYHGCSAFELEDDEANTIVIDPWISDNPLAEKPVDEFDDVDTIFVTHCANDHLGDAPEIARQSDAPIVCDFTTSMVLDDNGFPRELLRPFAWGMEGEGDHWRARILEARHPSLSLSDRLIGPAQAYVIEFGGETIYHLGDTSIFRDIELFGDLYEPTICCIPVGETSPAFSAELFPDEAALVAEWLAPHAETILPMHYPPQSEKPARFEQHCADRDIDRDTSIERIRPDATIEL